MSRFLNRVWRLMQSLLTRLAPAGTPLPEPLSAADRDLHRLTHHTIQRVHEDLATRFHFNTAISAIMEHTTGLATAEQASGPVLREAVDVLLLLLAPLVPHFAAELWAVTGHASTLDAAAWPAADPRALVRDLIELPVQVNGKLRGRITVPTDAPESEIVAAALGDAQVQGHLAGRPVRRQVVVPGRLVSLVV
jgi:leucyl-tRNA synthetase